MRLQLSIYKDLWNIPTYFCDTKLIEELYVVLNHALWYTCVIRTNKMHIFYINVLI
jgi:hypothetical protein